MGRRFENGVNIDREVPEMKLPLLFGIFGSAFCATLSHYYAEIRPFITSISLFMTLDKMVLNRNDDLSKVHPIDPASMPNFVKGLKDSLPHTCPESLWESESIKLMVCKKKKFQFTLVLYESLSNATTPLLQDAGMSNNLACYPLLRRGRNVDILLAFDSSADIQTANWLGFAEGYAKQRKVQGWPVSIGWPKEDMSRENLQGELEDVQAHSTTEATEKLEEAKRDDEETEASKPLAQKKVEQKKKSALGYCTVWVGSKEEKSSDEEPPPSKAVEEDWELMKPDAGLWFLVLEPPAGCYFFLIATLVMSLCHCGLLACAGSCGVSPPGRCYMILVAPRVSLVHKLVTPLIRRKIYTCSNQSFEITDRAD